MLIDSILHTRGTLLNLILESWIGASSRLSVVRSGHDQGTVKIMY